MSYQKLTADSASKAFLTPDDPLWITKGHLMATDPYELTVVHSRRSVQRITRRLNRGILRGTLNVERLGAAIATEDRTTEHLPHSIGLSWIKQHKSDFTNAFEPASRRELFEHHLDNPYIDRVIEDHELFELLGSSNQEYLLRKIVERHPILGARWIITASVYGIFIPTVLELIFERLKSEKFTAEQISAFVASFLLGSHTGAEGQLDTWSPFIGARTEEESLEQALTFCAMKCPELFFSAQHDSRLEQRFNKHGIEGDDIAALYETAAYHITTDSLKSVSTEVLEKHGYVTGIPKLTPVPNQTTGDAERAYFFECMVAGVPTQFVEAAPSGYLNPQHPVLVYFRDPTVTQRADIKMYTAEFILPRASGTAM